MCQCYGGVVDIIIYIAENEECRKMNGPSHDHITVTLEVQCIDV